MLWKRALCCIVTQRKYHLLRSATPGHGSGVGGGCCFCCLLPPSAPLLPVPAVWQHDRAGSARHRFGPVGSLNAHGPRSAQMAQLYQRGDKCPRTWLTLTRTNIEVAKVNT